MNDSGRIRVLLMGDSPQLFFPYEKHLDGNRCECDFVECEAAVREVLDWHQFDLVLSLHTRQGARSPSLVELLRGSFSTLFYALRVEVGYWWVPVLRLGKECLGAPALRPGEFSSELNEILKEIKAGAARGGHPRERCRRPTSVPPIVLADSRDLRKEKWDALIPTRSRSQNIRSNEGSQ